MIYEDDVVTFVYLNGENIGWLNGTESVKFNMPNVDSVLTISYSQNFITTIHPEIKPFYSLQEAFNNQFLTSNDLQQIANLKNNTNEDDLPKIELAIEEEIKEDFCLINNISYGLDTKVPGSIRFFGKYNIAWGNTCYVVMVDNILDYGEVVGEEIVDGVKFNYDTTQRILVWVEYK